MFGVKSPVAIGSGAGAVFDGDGRGDAAADEEVTGHLDPTWRAGSDQIVEDLDRTTGRVSMICSRCIEYLGRIPVRSGQNRVDR